MKGLQRSATLENGISHLKSLMNVDEVKQHSRPNRIISV